MHQGDNRVTGTSGGALGGMLHSGGAGGGAALFHPQLAAIGCTAGIIGCCMKLPSE